MAEPILFRRGIRNYWRLPYVLRVVLIAPVALVHAVSMGVLGFIEGFGDGLGIAVGNTRSDELLAELRGNRKSEPRTNGTLELGSSTPTSKEERRT